MGLVCFITAGLDRFQLGRGIILFRRPVPAGLLSPGEPRLQGDVNGTVSKWEPLRAASEAERSRRRCSSERPSDGGNRDHLGEESRGQRFQAAIAGAATPRQEATTGKAPTGAGYQGVSRRGETLFIFLWDARRQTRSRPHLSRSEE